MQNLHDLQCPPPRYEANWTGQDTAWLQCRQCDCMLVFLCFPHRSSCLQGFEERQATACNLRSVTLVTKRDIPVCLHGLQLSNSTDPSKRFTNVHHVYRLVQRTAELRCKQTVPSPPHQLRTADGGCDSSR